MTVQVRVRRPCKQCDGEGVIYNRCGVCWKRVPGATVQWKDDTLVLPCGHSAREFIEEADCLACEGIGWFEGWIDLESLATAIQTGESVVRLVEELFAHRGDSVSS